MKPWLNKTFADALQWAAGTHGERDAYVHHEERLTYRRLLERVDDFARGLIDLGIRPGDHVSLWMRPTAWNT